MLLFSRRYPPKYHTLLNAANPNVRMTKKNPIAGPTKTNRSKVG